MLAPLVHGYTMPGDTITVQLPWSEVCMHMRLADQVRQVRVLERGVQILRADGSPDGGPITHGEAGLMPTELNGHRVLRYVTV